MSLIQVLVHLLNDKINLMVWYALNDKNKRNKLKNFLKPSLVY